VSAGVCGAARRKQHHRGLLFRFGAVGDVRRRGEGPDRAAS
jgi:hypothetical protein